MTSFSKPWGGTLGTRAAFGTIYVDEKTTNGVCHHVHVLLYALAIPDPGDPIENSEPGDPIDALRPKALYTRHI